MVGFAVVLVKAVASLRRSAVPVAGGLWAQVVVSAVAELTGSGGDGRGALGWWFLQLLQVRP